MIRILVEPWESLKRDWGELTKLHYAEIGREQDKVPLDVDYATYDRLWAAGTMLCVSVRDDDRLVGYCVFFIFQGIHYKTTKVAQNDVIYILPEFRKGRNGIKLIEKVEKLLEAMGVRRILWHIKPDEHDFSPIVKRRGYHVHETVYAKLLGD